jgi:hypothetical protein
MAALAGLFNAITKHDDVERDIVILEPIGKERVRFHEREEGQ